MCMTTVGQHCARLFVYLCISIFPEVQKCYVFWHCARLFLFFQKSRNVMFSGTVPDYLFIYVFLFFQKSRKVMFSGTVPDYFLTLHDETADNELEMWRNSCESSSL